MRKAAAALFVAGSATAVAFWRSAASRRRQHVDLYFADGSMISLRDGNDQAGRLIPLATEVLAAARS